MVDKNIEFLTNLIIEANSLSVAKVNKKNKKNLVLTPEIQTLYRMRNGMRRRWQRTRVTEAKKNCDNLTKNINEEILQIQNTNWNNLLKDFKASAKPFWNITRAIKNKNRQLPPLKLNDKFLITDFEKANAIANQFYKSHVIPSSNQCPASELVVENSIKNLNDMADLDTSSINMFLTTAELIAIVKRLKPNKASGEDKIKNLLIKQCPKLFFSRLCLVFNACFELGYFPNCWKNAQVIPIPKPLKDSSNPNNYRPISLLSSISKIFERCLLKGLYLVARPKKHVFL